jgi:hypothetical protein
MLRRRTIDNVVHFEAKKLIFSRGLSKFLSPHAGFSSLKQILILTISVAIESFHKTMR